MCNSIHFGLTVLSCIKFEFYSSANVVNGRERPAVSFESQNFVLQGFLVSLKISHPQRIMRDTNSILEKIYTRLIFFLIWSCAVLLLIFLNKCSANL